MRSPTVNDDFFPVRHRRRPRIEIIPMVDVMFLLLVFYVLSSLAMTRQRGIAVDLPAAQTAAAPSSQPELVVSLSPRGKVFLNRHETTLDDLSGAVSRWAESHPNDFLAAQKQGVVLNLDQACSHRQVVRLLDRLRQSQLSNFVIATDQT